MNLYIAFESQNNDMSSGEKKKQIVMSTNYLTDFEFYLSRKNLHVKKKYKNCRITEERAYMFIYLFIYLLMN